MKKNILMTALFLFSVAAWAQERSITIGGGYAFANIEESETNATGFRINGLYEFNPQQGSWAHGFSLGYIGTSGEAANGAEYKINSWPIYYAPKYLIGQGSTKGFIKGAIGMQFSGFKRTGLLGEFTSNDAGFYGGLGAGVMKSFNEKMFINLEYEWAYLSNGYYVDGFMNTVSLGIGVKF
jgi:opacity protein-like surface antigen